MYRDTVRRFWRGDFGQVGDLAQRLCGSPDLYQDEGRRPYASVNGRPIRGSGVKDILWLRPDGQEMSDEDWAQPHIRCFGFRLAGDAMDEYDERGERLIGDTLLILLNAHDEPVPFVLPPLSSGGRWEVLVDTSRPESGLGDVALRGGKPYRLPARSLVLFRRNGAGRRRR